MVWAMGKRVGRVQGGRVDGVQGLDDMLMGIVEFSGLWVECLVKGLGNDEWWKEKSYKSIL